MSITQKIRAQIIAESYKPQVEKNTNILDIGCGNGVVSRVLISELEINLTGSDIIDYRTEKIPFKKMELVNKLPFNDKEFDYAFLNDVLHHTSNIEELILEAARVAKRVLIFEDQETFFLKVLDITLNNLYCPQMPCPLNFKTEKEWVNIFSNLGFDYEQIKLSYPFWYPLKHMSFILY